MCPSAVNSRPDCIVHPTFKAEFSILQLLADLSTTRKHQWLCLVGRRLKYACSFRQTITFLKMTGSNAGGLTASNYLVVRCVFWLLRRVFVFFKFRLTSASCFSEAISYNILSVTSVHTNASQ